MCVGQSPRAHPLGSAREKRCGRALRWHKQQLICPMPNTPEVSGWQSLGQASEQCWSWAWSKKCWSKGKAEHGRARAVLQPGCGAA